MRAYYFGNMYLSSIQQGIQAAHATAKMFVKYANRAGDANGILFDWATNHSTMILLNAGYGSAIHDLVDFFSDGENPFPWAKFYESPEALDNAITCAGIILPEKIYDTAAMVRNDPDVLDEIYKNGTLTVYGNDDEVTIRIFTKWEFDLVKKLNTFGLAK